MLRNIRHPKALAAHFAQHEPVAVSSANLNLSHQLAGNAPRRKEVEASKIWFLFSQTFYAFLAFENLVQGNR